QRRDVLHDFPLAAEGADWQAATDHFAQCGQVRGDAVVTLGSAEGDPETGHHFVENQYGAVLVTHFPQTFQEARDRRDAVHVAGHRLHDDRGNLVADLLERFPYAVDVVVGKGNGVLGQAGRDARGVGHAQGQGAGTGFHQQRVHVPVVAAFKLHNLFAVGVATVPYVGTQVR